jgi:WD40 repeat protein
MCAADTKAGSKQGINISGGLGGAELVSPRIITGGKDGFVHVFNIQLIKEWSLDLKTSSPSSACPQIQAVSTKEGRIIIGTKACEIYEVNSLNPSEMFRYVQGHFGSRAEVWGLAVHPQANKLVTSGDDGTIRLWDAKGLQQIAITNLGNDMAYVMHYKIICIAFQNDMYKMKKIMSRIAKNGLFS